MIPDQEDESLALTDESKEQPQQKGLPSRQEKGKEAFKLRAVLQSQRTVSRGETPPQSSA